MIRHLGYPGALTDVDALARHLAVTGWSSTACSAAAKRFALAAKAVSACSTAALGCADARDRVDAGRTAEGGCATYAFYVPGRIEVLGKHTDYAGGRTMVAAVEQGFAVVAAPLEAPLVRVIAVEDGQTVEFPLSPDLTPKAGHWANYPQTVVRRIARNFPTANRGIVMAFISDLPQAAGMSSSSALMVSTFLALEAVNHLRQQPEFVANVSSLTDLAGYLGTVENGQTFGTLVGDRGVGTFGGSEDHTAMLCGESGRISQYRYCPVEFERRIALPEDCVFAVASSGAVAEKTGAAMERYNRASRLIRALADVWGRATGTAPQPLARVLAAGPDAMALLRNAVWQAGHPDFAMSELLSRLDHLWIENEEIVPAAGDALEQGDLETFGQLVDRSQEAAEQLLGNQVPETVSLAALARESGAIAASAFGAGFGGSVWALVRRDRAPEFLRAWREMYVNGFPHRAAAARFFLTAAGPAAFQVC